MALTLLETTITLFLIYGIIPLCVIDSMIVISVTVVISVSVQTPSRRIASMF